MREQEFCVYALAVCGTDEVFYYGKGKYPGRPKKHRRMVNNPRTKEFHLYRKIRKLWENGLDYYEKILLRTFNEQEAFDLERKLISEDTTGKLCNMTGGGEGSVLNEEQREKLREQMLNSENYQKMIKSQKERVSKRVRRLDTGKIYASMTEAANDLDVYVSGVCYAIKNCSSVRGVMLELYTSESSEEFTKIEYQHPRTHKRCIRMDTLEIFDSLSEAAKSIGFSENYRIDLNQNETCDGIIVRYYESGMENLTPIPRDISKIKRRPVRNKNTGRVFESTTEAAKSINRNVSTLTIQIDKRRPCNGYLFEYVDSPYEEMNYCDPAICPVRRLDTGEVYQSITEAAIAIGRARASLSAAIKRRGLCAGILFEYVKDDHNATSELQYLPTSFI